MNALADVSADCSYKVLNAFVDGGWLAKLPPIQTAVFIAYLRHANFKNDSGRSGPGTALLAREIGHAKGQHVRAARAALVAAGLLELISEGSMLTKTPAIVRVLMPRAIASGIGTRPESGRSQHWDASADGTQPGTGRGSVRDSDAAASRFGTHNHEENHEGNHDAAAASEIYSLYPKKVGKPAALKAITSAIKRVRKRGTPDPVGYLKARTRVWAAIRAEARVTDPDADKYTKHPQGWFNGDRFDDVDLKPVPAATLESDPLNAPRAPITPDVLVAIGVQTK